MFKKGKMKIMNNILDKDYWITKDGRKLRPKDFEDKHLINTIKFIERGGDSDYLWFLYMETQHRKNQNFLHCGYKLISNATQMAMEQELDMTYIDWDKKQKLYILLTEEVKRRELMNDVERKEINL